MMWQMRWKLVSAMCALAMGLSMALAAPVANDAPAAEPGNLVHNSDFGLRNGNGKGPADYELSGNVLYQYLGDPKRDVAGWGVALESGKDLIGDGKRGGAVSQTVAGIDAKAGRWFRFTFRGLPQEQFAVDGDGLFMKVEFFSKGGKTARDAKAKPLYALVQQDRRDMTVNGDRHVGGAAIWRTYRLDFMLPFEDVDQVRLSVGFDHGSAAQAGQSQFFVTGFQLARIDAPAAAAPQAAVAVTATTAAQARPERLIAIGGRWFYKAKDGETQIPKLFDDSNADRLFYHDDVWGTPFAGMMTSWLRAGDKDISGKVVDKDRLVADNVTVRFDATSMIIHTRGLPNHPTGKFPEAGFGQGGNPNYIQEQDETFYIPLDPQPNPRHIATAADNSNHALPMGPIGVAANGVVFFNPFDMGNTDASSMMDRCCGHPNQDNLYHYHKYPICMNSPWADEGTGHSPLIGWAFDGYPIYGPYVKAGLMAKDAKGDEGLNDFNIHFDSERGWHYQVTPGKFPYIIGGYWGTEDSRDKQHPRGRGAGGPGGGNGPMGGPGGGPPGGPGGPRGFGPPPG